MSSRTHLLGRSEARADRRARGRDSSPAIARSIAIVCRNLVHESSALLSIGRFDLIRTLGRGGNGIVYEAFDPLRRELVALKVLYERGPSYSYRLKQEFRSLAELRHPSLVALYELSVGPDEAYFTMERIVGHDFLSYVHEAVRRGEGAVARLRDGLVQLCEGIHALHCAGKLHRDLKPSNVLVTDSGRVALLDFGLAGDALAQPAIPEGTSGYMAPEQARGAACESSDWFSFGCMLRQALDVITAAPANDRDGLERLALRLTSADPALRPGFAEIIATVRTASPPPPLSLVTAHNSFFVARRPELGVLADAFERSGAQPVVVLLRGESGVGKSALLRHFASTVESSRAERPALVLRGRCYERESLPYKALDSLVDELSRVLLALPSDHAARQCARADAALIALFPVLGRVPWLLSDPAKLAAMHPLDVRSRGAAALRGLLTQLSTDHALVLCIDDLQWSDADSGRLLGALLCEEDSPNILLVATDRTDMRATNPAIAALQGVAELAPRPLCVEELRLKPLGPDDSVELTRALVASFPSMDVRPDEVARICVEARGNARVLSELARWAGERTAAARARQALTMEALLTHRLRELSAPSMTVLKLVCAAGRPLSTRVIAAAAELGSECHAQVKALRAGGLLRAVLRGEDEWLELEHDRIGEAILTRTGHEARVELHVRLIGALQTEQADSSEPLIDQYLGAGLPLQAARCARHGADAAMAALAFTRAARLYEQALELGGFSPEERAALHRDHAVALDHAGRGLESANAYRAAAALTREPLAAAPLEQRAADQLLRNGSYREGEVQLRRVYHALGLSWPRSRLSLLLAIGRLLLPSALRRMSKRERAVGTAVHRLRAEVLSSAGRGLENYDLLRAIYNALLCFDEGEQLGDRGWQARVRGARGLMRSMSLWPGGVARGLHELESACTTAAEIGDAAAHAEVERQLAVARYVTGRSREALDAASRCEARLRLLPNTTFDINNAVAIIGASLFDLGRLREARQRWHTLTHAARLHGDLVTIVWIHTHPAQLGVLFATEERARAQAILDRAAGLRAAHPRYFVLSWTHAACSLEHAAYWGAPGDALRVLQREQLVLFGPRVSIMRSKARMLRARACVLAASALAPGRPRTALLRVAALDAAALRWSRNPNCRGFSWLLSAAIALLRQKRARSIAHLDAAGRAFDECEARLMSAAARYCKGMLLGGEAGASLRGPALAAFQDEGVIDPPRYIAWLACGFGELLAGEQP